MDLLGLDWIGTSWTGHDLVGWAWVGLGYLSWAGLARALGWMDNCYATDDHEGIQTANNSIAVRRGLDLYTLVDGRGWEREWKHERGLGIGIVTRP